MSTEGLKNDIGKLRYDLICPEIEESLAKVFTFGAEKYGERNCEKGFRYSRLYAAARRHLASFWMGEDLDEEFGQEHLAHAIWNLSLLLVQTKRGTGEDDRVKL